MIILEAQLIPFGNVNAPRTRLCRVEISNDGSGTRTRGNYEAKLFSKGKSPRLLKVVRVENWPRKSKPAWQLIAKVFELLSVE